MNWNDDRVALLCKLWLEGFSANHIARQLGQTTRNAVIGKIHRLGLAARAAPARPARRPSRTRARSVWKPLPQPAQVSVSDPLRAVIAELDPRRFAGGVVATVLSLRDGMCKYPIGDPSDRAFAFCGRDACRGSYCYDHARLAYQPRRAR